MRIAVQNRCGLAPCLQAGGESVLYVLSTYREHTDG